MISNRSRVGFDIASDLGIEERNAWAPMFGTTTDNNTGEDARGPKAESTAVAGWKHCWTSGACFELA